MMAGIKHFGVWVTLLTAALTAGLLTLATPAWAAPFTVNSTADAVDAAPGNGICETATGNGVCTLRAAIQEANASAGDDTITVPAGTYTLTIPNDEDQFQSDIPEDQSAKGDLDIRSNTTIDGAGAASTTVNGGDLDRIFDIVFNTGATVDLSGLTITNGNVQISDDGGGISVGLGTTLDLDDSTVSDNTVFFRGGGIKNFGTLTMTNSAVIDNTAGSSGGGIENVGVVTMTDSTVSDNKGTDFGVGGGISNTNGLTGITATVTMTNSTVSGNTSDSESAGAGRAGGISNNGGILTITDSTVSNNTATNTPGTAIAGGIHNLGGNLTMTSSTVSENSAPRFGGGILSETNLNDKKTTIKNSTISGNSVTGTGTQSVGGGIHNNTGRTVVENTTVTNNTAPADQGSGVASATGDSTSTELLSTIVSANANTDADVVFGQDNSFVSNGYDLIGDGNATSAFNQPGDQTNVTDPKLGPLADNGGPTQTHALLTTSPAIDAGPPVVPDANGRSCPPPDTDQRGETRPQDGDGNSGPRCDIGSFEKGPVPSTLSINDVSVKEGNKGSSDATFTVTRAGDKSGTSSVNHTTSNGTATAGSDYQATNGTLVFGPNETSKTITVPIIVDKRKEKNEYFFVNLSNATGATVEDGQGKATIVNDDKKKRRR